MSAILVHVDMSVDFLSAEFDPELALTAAEVSLPFQNAKPLSNLAEYRQRCATSAPAGLLRRTCQKPEPLRTKYSSSAPVNRERRQRKNVITIMSSARGPLARLYQCMIDKTRVKVWTRRANEVRGVCLGYIVAFDRHWNLILSDVDDTYTVPVKSKSLALDATAVTAPSASDTKGSALLATTIVPRPTKVKLFGRHIAQMFIRGENVAFVSI